MTSAQRVLPRAMRESPCVVIGHIALLSGLIISVLSFGGMETITRSVAEILICVSGLLLLSSRRALAEIVSQGAITAIAPLALFAAVALRLIPVQRLQPASRNAVGWHWPLSSADGYATSTHLLIIIACCAAFYYGVLAALDRSMEKRFVYTLIVVGTGEAFYGLVQYLAGWQKIFFYTKKYDLLEATGTYINRNHYAGLLEMVIPFSLGFCLLECSKLVDSRGNGRNQFRKIAAMQGFSRVVFWGTVTIVLVAGLIVSRSRMGILAAGASVAIIPLVRGVRTKRASRISLALICVFAGLMWIAGDPIAQRFAELNQEYALSQGSRVAIWGDTVRLIAQHPWAGTGLGTFPTVYTRVQTTFLGNFVNHAHNDYLEIASDMGIPAAVLLFGMIGLVGIQVAKRVRKGHLTFEKAVLLGCCGSLVAVLLHSLSDFNLYIPANALIFSSVLGLSSSQSLANRAQHSSPTVNVSIACKRGVDVVLSSVLLAIVLPISLVIALAIKLDSPGPVLFKARAAGRLGDPFDQLKFRTMTASHDDADRLDFETSETDPRITRVGRLLRRWSLDELPQLINVLAGDMSLVGPRPTFVEMVPRFAGQPARRFLVRPGITGLAQIRGRNLIAWEEKISFDLEYVERYSVWLDLKILIATVPVCVSGKGIYGSDGRVRLPECAECATTCRDHV